MLQSFRFGNHRSFRDEQQLNLMPAYPSDHQDEGEERDELQPVSIAGIFGANASGKTNVLDALAYMRHLVVQSDRDVEPERALKRSPFRLVKEASDEPSRYVVDLLLSGERITYGFTVVDEGVLEEWLYHYPRSERYSHRGRAAKVFERVGDEFTWGPSYDNRKDLRDVSEITASTALFIATVSRFKLRQQRSAPDDPLHQTYLWFTRFRLRRHSSYPSSWLPLQYQQSLGDIEFRAVVKDLLRVSDFGITEMNLVQGDSKSRDELQLLEEAGDFARAAALRQTARDRLVFRHKGSDEGVMLEFNEESQGTQQMLRLGTDAVRAVNTSSLLVIDEIDASLHPLLAASLINLFRTRIPGKPQAQLIFTSHDATLLGHLSGEEVLRRDEIWFAEKGDDGRSLLYSLAEFKPRKEGENRERRYLNGSYGAIPEISSSMLSDAVHFRLGGNDESA